MAKRLQRFQASTNAERKSCVGLFARTCWWSGGHFNPVLNLHGGGSRALGQHAVVNTVYGVGSPTFSGSFSHANPTLAGAFNGLFTGPSKEELMARRSAEFVNPATQQNEKMFGIRVGKKDGEP